MYFAENCILFFPVMFTIFNTFMFYLLHILEPKFHTSMLLFSSLLLNMFLATTKAGKRIQTTICLYNVNP